MMRDNAKNWSRTPAPRIPAKIHSRRRFLLRCPGEPTTGLHALRRLQPPVFRRGRGCEQLAQAAVGDQRQRLPHTRPTSRISPSPCMAARRRSAARLAPRSTTSSPPQPLSFSFVSTFDVLINHNTLTFEVGRVAAGNFSNANHRGSAGAGSLQLLTEGNDRANWTYMPSLIWRHDGRVWKMEGGFAYSRASNRNRNVSSGFFDSTTARRTGVTVTFDDIFYLRPRVITVTDAAGVAVDPYSIESYVMTAATGETRSTDDTKRTLYGNVRRSFYGEVPFTLRAGLDFRQSARDQRFSTPTYSCVGADRVREHRAIRDERRPRAFLEPRHFAAASRPMLPEIQGDQQRAVLRALRQQSRLTSPRTSTPPIAPR